MKYLTKITKKNFQFSCDTRISPRTAILAIFKAGNQAKFSKTLDSCCRLPLVTDSTPGERHDFVVVHRGSIVVVHMSWFMSWFKPLKMICGSLSWFMMFCHVLSWFVVVRHGLSWFVMFCGGSSWFVMVCHGSSWFTVMVHCHGSSWFTVMVHCHGSSWFTVMVRHGSLSWFVMVHCHGSSWFVMVRHGSLSWFRHGSSWFVMCYSLKFSRKGHVTLNSANQSLKFTIKSHFWWDFLFSPFHLKSIPLKSSAKKEVNTRLMDFSKLLYSNQFKTGNVVISMSQVCSVPSCIVTSHILIIVRQKRWGQYIALLYICVIKAEFLLPDALLINCLSALSGFIYVSFKN